MKLYGAQHISRHLLHVYVLRPHLRIRRSVVRGEGGGGGGGTEEWYFTTTTNVVSSSTAGAAA